MTLRKMPDPNWPGDARSLNRLQLAGPLYLQIRDKLRERILDLQWSPGAMLPNEAELAREFTVSVGTIRKALETLEAERMIVRKQGRGTFVSDMAGNNMAVRFCRYYHAGKPVQTFKAETIESRLANPTPPEAAKLRIPPNAQVARISRRRIAAGRCTMYEIVTVPAALFPDIDCQPDLPPALYSFYRKTYDISIVRVIEQVRPVSAGQDVASMLGVAPGTAILSVEREAYDAHGRPVELRRQHVHIEDCEYRVEME